MQAVDILILSNGPGELATWVRPVLKALRQHLDRDRARISVVLSPCPHASGREAAIALSYPEVDRVQAPEHFWSFLWQGNTADNWNWREQGVVLFLGGDQIFPVIIGKRLGYRTVVYAEWQARWYRWIDRFGAMTPESIDKVPPKYARKLTVVGDLMAEVGKEAATEAADLELVGILPGSKPAKLAQGVPLGLAIAERIARERSHTRFMIPVAPTLDLDTLARFADPESNPLIRKVGWTAARLHRNPEGIGDDRLARCPYLETASGVRVALWTPFPAYELLSQCRLCLTTVGANTAELGSLAVPMLVLLPTQQLDAMRAWDGLPGLLANLPGVGSAWAKAINWLVLRQGKRFAWPNIWANQQVVPELVGRLDPAAIAGMAMEWLEHPEQLAQVRDRLRQVRGQPGAASRLARLAIEQLD